MGELFAGRYELVDPLGDGGMGSVWRAWDHRDRRYLAAKVLRQADASSLLRFVREQSYRISHPHVVTPLGWAGEDDRVLFTMPIVRGGSVATLLGDFGALPPTWAAVLLDQLLDALTAVHAAGVVHRDIKPANLLLEPTGRGRPHLRLSDFGIAAPVNAPRLTRASAVVGTPGYFAPEQLRGAGPEPAQDLYAAGVVTAEMLTGAAPVGEVNLAQTSPPQGCPASLWQLLGELGHPQPGMRPESAGEARAQLSATGLLSYARDSAHGSDVEVFNHVPDLPPGWGPHGPLPRSTPPPPAMPRPSEEPAAMPRTLDQPAVVPRSSPQPAGMPRSSPQPADPQSAAVTSTRGERQRGRLMAAVALAILGIGLLTVAALLFASTR